MILQQIDHPLPLSCLLWGHSSGARDKAGSLSNTSWAPPRSALRSGMCVLSCTHGHGSTEQLKTDSWSSWKYQAAAWHLLLGAGTQKHTWKSGYQGITQQVPGLWQSPLNASQGREKQMGVEKAGRGGWELFELSPTGRSRQAAGIICETTQWKGSLP